MIVVELSDNRGVLYTTITKGGIIMIPAAGTVGLRILKTLYKTKGKIGKASAYLADKAGKAGLQEHLKQLQVHLKRYIQALEW
jgi:hypothetical protein